MLELFTFMQSKHCIGGSIKYDENDTKINAPLQFLIGELKYGSFLQTTFMIKKWKHKLRITKI